MMPHTLGSLCRLAAAATVVWAAPLRAEPLRIGVLNDMSGPIAYSGGPGSVIAARMAVEDAGGTVLGRPIEVLGADTQNKPDVASAIAARWYDQEGVDAIVDLPVTSVALAVQSIASKRGKIVLITGAGSTALIGESCAPTSFLWTYNTYSLAHGTALALTQIGLKTWFFLTADYAFGVQMQKDASEVVTASGGQVLGAARHPFNTNDFSSYLLAAQASRAQVIGLANGGPDTVNGIKQAAEFGLTKAGQHLAAMILYPQDVVSIGLEQAQGLTLTTPFYWNQDAAARQWSERFMARSGGVVPTELQAGVYSAVADYLKGLAVARTDDGAAVATAMRSHPVDDFMTDHATIRADGYVQRGFRVFQVKSPAESTSRWDVYKQVDKLSPDVAAPPITGSSCALLK